MNRISCGDFVHGLYRIGQPQVMVVFGGLLDAAVRAKEVADQHPDTVFWLAGNAVEQERFLAVFRPARLVRFDVSSNTRDEARKIITKASQEDVHMIGFIDYEFHVIRTTLTLVGTALAMGATTTFLPYAYIDCDRSAMLPVLREMGCLVEGIKLWHYQRKKHIATLQQAMEYYGLGKERSLPEP